MKQFKTLLLLLILCASLTACAQTVHYTRTGEKYHIAYCKYLRKSDYTCTLKEALQRGLTPCSHCNPPTEVEKPKEEKKKPARPVKKTPKQS